jgi:AcrR family transcriptional regulator
MVSETMSAATPTGVRRRPRNRRALIIEAAIVLFHRDGYHQVGMEDIAAAVDITGGALYRHFRGKQELLAEAMLTVIDEYVAIAEAAAPEGLDAVQRALTQRVIDSRDRGPLWQVHARDLSAEQQTQVRRRLRVLARRVAAAIRSERPELVQPDADLLAWATLAIVGSPSEHGATLPRPRFDDLICQTAAAVCGTPRLPHPDRPRPNRANQTREGLKPASRREILLVTAGKLFQDKGFEAVTMEAIGAAAGISGPAVYNHFASKGELLTAIVDRGRESLQLRLTQALSSADTPGQALEPVVRSYVTPALRSDTLTGLLYTELRHLPDQQRQAGRRAQRDYVDEWARLLPVPQAEGRIVVHAALGMINSLVRIPHLRSRPEFADEVVGLALDALRSVGTPD